MKEFLISLVKLIGIYLKIIFTLPFKKVFYTKKFWKELLTLLFVKLFWYGLAMTVLFLLMIPAMKSGDLSVGAALLISFIAGLFGNFLSGTYTNPVHGITDFFKKLK